MRKIFVLFLALCLLAIGPAATLPAEPVYAAEAGATVYAETSEELSLSLSDTAMPYESVTFAVEPHAVYQLTFSYALAEAEKAFVKITGLTEEDAEASYPVTKPMLLPATGGANVYESMSVNFIAEDIPAEYAPLGEACVSSVRIGFEGLPIAKKASAETIMFTVKDIKIWRVQNLLYLANGSAELLDGETPAGIAGGTLITENAKDGENMMQVVSGETLSMTLGTLAAGENVQLRGFAMAEGFTNDSSLTVSLYHNKVDASRLICQKTFTLDGDAAAEGLTNNVWKYLRFSALPAPMGNLVATFSVQGEGAAYIDAVTLEADANILKNPHFLQTETGWRVYNERQAVVAKKDEKTEQIQYFFAPFNSFYSIRQTGNADATPPTRYSERILETDGKCPDGQRWVQFDNDGGTTATDLVPGEDTLGQVRKYTDVPVAITQNSISLQENEKYLISFWYKAETNPELVVWFDLADVENDETAYQQYDGTVWTVPTKEQASKWGAISLGETGGEWKQVAYVYTVPKGVIRGRLTFAMYNSDATMALNMPSVQKVDESILGFYSHEVPDVTISADARPFVTLLGQPIETTAGFAGEMHGVHVFPTEGENPQTLSDKKIIVAKYDVDADGTRTLVSVEMGTEANHDNPDWFAAPPNSTGALRPNGTENVLSYVQYSEGVITVEDGDTVKEYKAFVWDSLSGLKPLAKAETVAG